MQGYFRTDPEWAWLLIRLEIPHNLAFAALSPFAQRDLDRGIKAGRFKVPHKQVALFAAGGALLAVMRAVLEWAEVDAFAEDGSYGGAEAPAKTARAASSASGAITTSVKIWVIASAAAAGRSRASRRTRSSSPSATGVRENATNGTAPGAGAVALA